MLKIGSINRAGVTKVEALCNMLVEAHNSLLGGSLVEVQLLLSQITLAKINLKHTLRPYYATSKIGQH